MECNKEEAVRAKVIAEQKMQNKDFLGARKIAFKAQQLYPELENVSQMITVCDVHCSAEKKVHGNEMDWYGILKIDSTADEASIKKQYRKLALLLHPDKNQFAGATDAFKLIGEAQRVLLDTGKRMLHDNKIKASRPGAVPNWAPQHASTYSNVRKQPWVHSHPMSKPAPPFASFNPQQQQPQPETFWTICPFCSVRYQYYRNVVNKLLSCQSCNKHFIGHEIKDQSTPMPPGTNSTRPVVLPQQKEVPRPAADFKPNVQNTRGNVDVQSKKRRVEESKGSRNFNGKKKKQVDELSESATSSSDSEEDFNIEEQEDGLAKEDFGVYREYPRRSTRSRGQVSYDDNLSDDDNDIGSPSKGVKGNGPVRAPEDPVEKQGAPKPTKSDVGTENGEIGANVESSLNSSPTVAVDPEFYEYPDPDFSDFDKTRGQGCFAVGQTWAVYDMVDGMPRFYARIRKVSSPGFKLRITWLEPEPDDEDKIKWVEAGMPVSCGKFKHGASEAIEDHPMFSHLVHWVKGSGRDTYYVYPRKGETWALFKNWDMKWHSESVSGRKYEYEFVEILSDWGEGIGVSVAYLGKVKGFSCLFCRTKGEEGINSFQVPPSQLFRFSHRVPSFQLTGEERQGVLKGSFELDPASLPANLEEIDVPEDWKAVAPNKKTQLDPDHISAVNCTEHQDSDLYEIPDPEFYNFDAAKSPEKFQVGQTWALYSDEDGLPKYYARITKIDVHPKFKLHITWLSSCALPKDTVKWFDKNMLTCCGMFRLQKDGHGEYTETGPFSHKVKAQSTEKKGVCAIFPRKGEVWALYKNWNAAITRADLKKSEYDMVELLEEDEYEFKVLVLEPVSGYKSIFKAQMEGGMGITREIPRYGLLRFSHQIPAFRLTHEKGGRLKGYWELDPAALPITLFRSS